MLKYRPILKQAQTGTYIACEDIRHQSPKILDGNSQLKLDMNLFNKAQYLIIFVKGQYDNIHTLGYTNSLNDFLLKFKSEVENLGILDRPMRIYKFRKDDVTYAFRIFKIKSAKWL